MVLLSRLGVKPQDYDEEYCQPLDACHNLVDWLNNAIVSLATPLAQEEGSGAVHRTQNKSLRAPDPSPERGVWQARTNNVVGTVCVYMHQNHKKI
jgi:hypothetical protein